MFHWLVVFYVFFIYLFFIFRSRYILPWSICTWLVYTRCNIVLHLDRYNVLALCHYVCTFKMHSSHSQYSSWPSHLSRNSFRAGFLSRSQYAVQILSIISSSTHLLSVEISMHILDLIHDFFRLIIIVLHYIEISISIIVVVLVTFVS